MMPKLFQKISSSFCLFMFMSSNSCFWFNLPGFGFGYGTKLTWPQTSSLTSDMFNLKRGFDGTFGFNTYYPFNNVKKYDLRSCHRVDNPTQFMNQFNYQNRNGYWTYCTRPNPQLHWTQYIPSATGQYNYLPDSYNYLNPHTPFTDYSSSYNYGYGFNNYGYNQFNQAQFLGKGRFDYLNGRHDVQLTCNLNAQGLKVVDRPVWQKVISTYDPQRTSYDCHPKSTTCTLSLITPDGLRYAIEYYYSVTYLKINNVQALDFGTYRCSANAVNQYGHIVAVYQIIDLLA